MWFYILVMSWSNLYVVLSSLVKGNGSGNSCKFHLVTSFIELTSACLCNNIDIINFVLTLILSIFPFYVLHSTMLGICIYLSARYSATKGSFTPNIKFDFPVLSFIWTECFNLLKCLLLNPLVINLLAFGWYYSDLFLINLCQCWSVIILLRCGVWMVSQTIWQSQQI